MHTSLHLLIACAALLAPLASAQDVRDDVHSTVLQEVVVTGEQPGPGLWKITKTTAEVDHVMWVLGTYGPLPRELVWRSKQVDAAIAESQAVLMPVKIDRDISMGSWFKIVTLMPAMLKADKNPDNATLKDVLPPDVYAKWLVQRQKYFDGDDRFEHFRPTFAAQELQIAARKHANLNNRDAATTMFESHVAKVARTHRIPVIAPEVELKLKLGKSRRTLNKFAKLQLPDIECFATTMDGLEQSVAAMIVRANAWAIGDVEKLRELIRSDHSVDCVSQLQTAAITGSLGGELGAQEQADAIKAELIRVAKEARDQWFSAAEKALANNRTTFAMLPVTDLLRTDGQLDQLRARGYQVDEP